MLVTIERKDHHATALAQLPEPRRGARPHVDYAMTVLPSTVTTQVVRQWLGTHGVEVSRQTVATHLGVWRSRNGVTTDTSGLPVLTDERLAELAGVEAAALQPELPEPDADTVSEPIETPQSTTPDEVSGQNDTLSDDVETASPEREIPAEAVDPSPRQRMGLFGDLVEPETATAAPAGTWARFKSGVEARAVWILYMGLISATAYGLYEVLSKVVKAPQTTAITAAVCVELVAIAAKVLADGAGRDGESYKVVRWLYAVSGLIAVGVAGVNAWGHAQIVGPAPEVSAVLYASASIAGFVLAAVATTLRRRAHLRSQGRLESAGMVIPAYVEARYGADVAHRAAILSRVAPGWTLLQIVDRARHEVAEEEAREAEESRLATLRAALAAQASAVHADPLAAQMAAAQYVPAELSKLMTADHQGHVAQVDALREWMRSHQVTPPASQNGASNVQ